MWWVIALGLAYVAWMAWRYRLPTERRALYGAYGRWYVVAWFAVISIVAIVFLVVMMPAHGATRWPEPHKLQRCMVELPKMKDAKLRRWCEYWSKRLP